MHMHFDMRSLRRVVKDRGDGLIRQLGNGGLVGHATLTGLCKGPLNFTSLY